MATAVQLRSALEARFPAAFAARACRDLPCLPTGIAALDGLSGGVPLHGLTEICGAQAASSGKTSVLISLLARATQRGQFCALVDAKDSFDPVTAEAAGVNLPHLLWVRCGKTRQKLRPLEQAFKVADMLLQSSGFTLIVVDLSGIGEKFVRNVPLSTWFRFSRVVEQQPAALVFLEQEPHATSCAALVLRVSAEPATLSGKLLTHFNLKVEAMRTRDKKAVQSANFPARTQWA
jgi:hypothetical protein